MFSQSSLAMLLFPIPEGTRYTVTARRVSSTTSARTSVVPPIVYAVMKSRERRAVRRNSKTTTPMNSMWTASRSPFVYWYAVIFCL